MSRKFSDIYIVKDTNNMFVVMGIYKGIRISLKVFQTNEQAQKYIDNDVL